MTATFSHVVRIERGVRDHADRRRRIDRHVVSYFDKSGREWRRVFKVDPGEHFIAPRSVEVNPID